MLEVHAFGHKIVIANGRRNIIITEKVLDTKESLPVLDGSPASKQRLVYKLDPMKVGDRYDRVAIVPQPDMVLMSDDGQVYQWKKISAIVHNTGNIYGWLMVGSVSYTFRLPDNYYTVLNVGRDWAEEE